MDNETSQHPDGRALPSIDVPWRVLSWGSPRLSRQARTGAARYFTKAGLPQDNVFNHLVLEVHTILHPREVIAPQRPRLSRSRLPSVFEFSISKTILKAVNVTL
jgi:hypothetical protein